MSLAAPLPLSLPPMQEFFEAIWHGEGIADGGDLAEALAGYAAVRPEDGDWRTACAAPGAEPRVERFPSFEAYLDNAEPSETIPVTAEMIEAALLEAALLDAASSEAPAGAVPSGEHDGHVVEAGGGGAGEP